MNTCKQCITNESRAKSEFCSDACNKKYRRSTRTNNPDIPNPDTAFIQPGQPDVYGRTAVRYQSDQWETRPMPLNPDDQPHTGGRGKYTRQDGTVYQFDSNGTAFEVVNGKVYQSTEEVQACYE